MREGVSCVKSDQEDKEGRTRQDLNLLLVDVHVGEGAPQSPLSEPTCSKGPCAPTRPQVGGGGGHSSTLTLSHCPSPAKAGGPEHWPASPTSPPAYLPPSASRHGGRPCLLPGESAARPDGADGGREAAKLSVWRCPSEPLLAGARRVGRRRSWAVRAFTETRPERRCLTARPPN